jgi:hypothetical protein
MSPQKHRIEGVFKPARAASVSGRLPHDEFEFGAPGARPLAREKERSVWRRHLASGRYARQKLLNRNEETSCRPTASTTVFQREIGHYSTFIGRRIAGL